MRASSVQIFPKPTYEELERQVAYYEDLLGISEDHVRLQLLREGFGMPPGPTWLLSRLMAADGRLVAREALLDGIPGTDRVLNRHPRTIDVYMVAVRRVLGFDAVETLAGQGYRLTPLGRLRCRRAVEAARLP